MPSRTGFTPGPTATTDPYANILKISKYQTNFFGGTTTASPYNSAYPSPNYASPSSTGDSSLNGRYIDNSTVGWTTNGWDKPALIDTHGQRECPATRPDSLARLDLCHDGRTQSDHRA